jgi:uncharacterized protein (UPF0332 family)
MIKPNFLNKLKEEKVLSRVEPSEEISKSYLIKSENCLRVAKLAFAAGIYENAVSEAYYSIYNTAQALFYRCGIKCENHSAAIILIKRMFGLDNFHQTFSDFKKDRIDNQYYVVSGKDNLALDKESCEDKIKTAQKFNFELRAYLEHLSLEQINKIREEFDKL